MFQDLQNVNPFDETFKKAVELAKCGNLHVPEASTDDTLHTPHILPHEENTTSKPQNMFNISRVPSLDEDLLKFGTNREVVGGEILSKLCGSSRDDHESLDSTFSISRVPSIDEDLLIIANEDSDSEKDADGIKNANVEEIKKVETDSNKALKTKLKEAVHSRLENGNHPLKLLDSGQGIIIAPVNMENIKNAESATIVINQKVDPVCMKFPRKRVSKQPSESMKKSNKSTQDKITSDKEKVRAMNRAAQSRSRIRKKKWIDEILTKIEDLTKENKNLMAQNEQLKNEVSLVRSILQYHNDCSATKDPETSKYNFKSVIIVITLIACLILEEKTERLIALAKQKLNPSIKKSITNSRGPQVPIRPTPILPAAPIQIEVPVVHTIPSNVQVCIVPALNSHPLMQTTTVALEDAVMKSVAQIPK